MHEGSRRKSRQLGCERFKNLRTPFVNLRVPLVSFVVSRTVCSSQKPKATTKDTKAARRFTKEMLLARL